eukprot:Stramenopile-MAST_4_protein_2120
MGSGVSQELGGLEEAQKVVRDLESVIACTSMLMGLNPRYIKFPDMYTIFDFEVSPEQTQMGARNQPLRNKGDESLALQTLHNDLRHFHTRDGSDDEGQKASKDDPKTDDEFDENGMFVFKGTVSPNAKVQGDNMSLNDDEHQKKNGGAISVMVPDAGLVILRTLNEPNKDGWTPLHACCHSIDMVQAAKVLIEEILNQGGDLNMKTKRGPGSLANGYTPLHIACAYGVYETVEALMNAGALPSTRNSLDQTPLHEVCYRGFPEIAGLLIERTIDFEEECAAGPVIPAHPLTVLSKSCRYGHKRIVKMLLEAGADKDYQESETGWTAIMEAAYFFHDEIVEILLASGANPNLKTSDGQSVHDLCTSPSIRKLLQTQNGIASPKKSPSQGRTASPLPHSGASSALSESDTSYVGGTDSSEFKLLGALPVLDTSPGSKTKRDALEAESKAADEEKMANWRRQRRQEMVEEAAKVRAQKEERKKRRKRRQYKEALENSLTPAEFICPLTMKLMKEPVLTPYGQTYEKAAIHEYLDDYQNRCPKTGQPLARVDLQKNEKLRKKIKTWKRGILENVGENKKLSPKSKTALDGLLNASDDEERAAANRNMEDRTLNKGEVSDIKYHQSPTSESGKSSPAFKTTAFADHVSEEDEYEF